MSKKFIPVTAEHFQYINGILAHLSQQNKKNRKKSEGFKWWLLNQERNARHYGNIDEHVANQLEKKYKSIK